MDEVVNGDGTAGRSRLPFPDIQMAGKTGTAQVRNIGADRGRAGAAWRYRDHGLFVFFAPVGAPRYAGAVVIEHGLGGARAAAPVASDVLTYLFDKDQAMDGAAAARGRQWGGNIAERMARRAAAWAAAPAGAPPPPEPGLMALAFVPKPIARAALADADPGRRHRRLSACSSSIRRPAGRMTWARPQAVRFAVFLAHGARACRGSGREWIKQAAFPAYVVVLVLLIIVEALGFVGGGAQRWLNLGFIRLQPSRADEAGDRARLRPFLFAAAGARDQAAGARSGRPAVLIGIPAAL